MIVRRLLGQRLIGAAVAWLDQLISHEAIRQIIPRLMHLDVWRELFGRVGCAIFTRNLRAHRTFDADQKRIPSGGKECLEIIGAKRRRIDDMGR